MKQFNKFITFFALIAILSSCVKEGHVAYRFELRNATDKPMTVSMSSWGGYAMYINGMFDSKYKFHEVESINAHSFLMFDKSVGDNPNPYVIPSSLTPAWEYITAIECDGVSIPKEYFADSNNWELYVANQINGTFTEIILLITPELLEQFRNNLPDEVPLN